MIDKKPWNCSVCNASFEAFSQLTKHKEEHSLKSMMDNNFKQNSTNENTQGSKRKCSVCQKTFPDKDSFLDHPCASQLVTRIYKCKTCPREFLYMCKLTQHEKIHVMDKPYKCYLCHCSFTHPCHLGRHTMTHSDSANTKCIVCAKVFKTSAHLETHKLTHNTKTFFKCDFCSQISTDQFWIATHLDTHADKVNFGEDSKTPLTEESHSVLNNNRSQKRKSSFQSHQAKSLAMASDNDNEKHILENTAKKNLEIDSECQKIEDAVTESENKAENSLKETVSVFCDICNKSFDKNKEFEYHQKLHALNERPDEYVCKVCNRYFNKCSLYESHVRKHHDQNQILSNGVNKQYLPTRPSLFEKFDNLVPPEPAVLEIPVRKPEISPVKSENSLALKDSTEYFISANFPTRAKRPVNGDFRCLICCKAFANSYTLDFHLDEHIIVKTLPPNRHAVWSIHFPQKKFSCKICRKSFSQRIILQGHLRIMHRGLNRIPVR